MDVPPNSTEPPYGEPQPAQPAPQPSPRAYNLAEKPGKVTAIILLTLISGGLNIFIALGGATAIATGTLGLGLVCCAPVAVLPGVLGVFEVLYAFDLMAYPPKRVRPNQTIAILEIICISFGNVVAAITGIVALIFYNDPEVQAYFTTINRQPPAY